MGASARCSNYKEGVIILSIKTSRLIPVLCGIAISLGVGNANASADHFSRFKQTITPSYLLGVNGLVTIPTADTVGRHNAFVGATVVDAGEVAGESLYNVRASAVFGSSDDVELGYTRNTLIWDNGDRTEMDADVFHFKVRLLNLANSFIPKVAFGTLAMSVRENEFDQGSDVLFAPFVVATSRFPLADGHELTVTADMEWLHHGGQDSEQFFNAGIAGSFWHEKLTVVLEKQGIGRDGDDAEAVTNVAVQAKLYDMFTLGLGVYDLDRYSDTDEGMMIKLGFSLPLGEWLGGDK